MDTEAIFQTANSVAMLSWIALVFVPRWKYTKIIFGFLIPGILLTFLYLVVISLSFGQASGGFGSLISVRKLFQNDFALLAGWVHYLAFDLWIGAWIVNNSERTNIPHWMVIPSLVLTFLFGPIGLLLYLVIRMVKLKGGSSSVYI
ncbi:hypothetical protein LPTSP4_24430 [Leptospira ryugenii]|uniref:DUF4281 domain-containing protein n=1 Tax=Leptospira ryugenii TaxID=1917863 RepID=A0A2P2E275_9LEPT|nr:ABA4-like family protein [Leptospira ryugenii]GBF50916.1 hypothetical protein LPTSP4_24430 [Leptospira ryugenii]